ncbi:T9SS type B sorting domain-containing protein [Kordia sp. YSTF-M3]|uniref:T9SS type B sorting domain-containing protein n=1 Tax=Kordia aestuariivivens TaxID=2759037 RepID=A0ABR7Q8N5_9FLAO|nr:T9SS type B sorting domain-containing protein [Kordia aestuariivivens]MBC8754908.1 T9SS type B sorting domain-containing protein [Kordia aestuariivivens]
MKYKIILFACIVLSSTFCFSQGEANIWYFGENAGLDFNSGTPVAITDGQIDTLEGCATISDSSGQLLFYTDGITVWDVNHNIMPNGTGLQGNPSSSQSGIIVPFPNDTTRYYIFSVNHNASDGGLFYSVVDLTLNGGTGDIVAGQKNIELLRKSAEKIAAINDDGNGYWVIAYAGLTGNETTFNTYHAYRITDSGINTVSVTSSYPSCSSSDGRGYLKISPDSQKIVNCNQILNHVCMHRFENTSGIVSPEIEQLQTNGRPYCAEFSASSEKLYVSTGGVSNGSTSLFQFTLSAADVQASRVLIHSETQERGALQLATDGKIYYARPDRTFMGAINDPEADGVACNYVNQAVDLNGRMCKQGLPPFIQSFLNVGIQTTETCFGDATAFTVNANETLVSVLWDFGDSTTSTLENPTHTYASPGVYMISVTVNSPTQSITRTSTVTIYDLPIANSIADVIVCDDVSNDGSETLDLSTKDAEALLGQPIGSNFDVSYYETMDDAVNDTNVLPTNYTSSNNNQEIFVKVFNIDNPNCYAISSFRFIINLSPVPETIADISICDTFNDTQESVSLSQFTSQVLGAQNASDFDVYYYETMADADLDTNRLSANYTIQNATQTIFARKENSQNSTCFVVTDFTFILQTQYVANAVNDLIVCDDVSNDGTELFDLSVQDVFIANGQTGAFSIKYYTSQVDADADTNEISTNFSNDTNPQEIFVRIENDVEPTCFDTTSFFIEVKDVPNVDTSEMISYLCTNESVTISADGGFDEYLWSTGETTTSITVTEPGIYTVTVTTNYASSPAVSCSNTQTIRVIESDEAVITDVIIQDWTFNSNQVEIIAEGIGDYEYSIDGFNYQDSPIFMNLLAGNLTVYVRDKNGCGVVSQEVSLLFYPGFFTPNSDGFNDFWQIISSEYELDLRIYIFNRYGKLLKILKPESQGWDGTYNGKQMPSSDYWFLVERPSNGLSYKGHFTLKR